MIAGAIVLGLSAAGFICLLLWKRHQAVQERDEIRDEIDAWLATQPYCSCPCHQTRGPQPCPARKCCYGKVLCASVPYRPEMVITP